MHQLKTCLSVALALCITACSTLTLRPEVSLKPGTEWVATSQEWRQEALAVFDEASDHVKPFGETRPAKSWAVILDLDETVLNNVAYQISRESRGATYTPESWFAWTQKEQATLVPGAFEFIEMVNQLGGHVAFVTNRRDIEQFATEANLAALGLKRGEDYRVLLTRGSPDGASDKSARFALVPDLLSAQGYLNVEIIAYLGDNLGDRPERLGNARFFCIDQGAMYGDPCAEVPGPGR